ncbi:GNAT family N-acetyltransferase [Gorillibacterium sp. sgz500922]|uniref:GNAT family N-acetyltransferase n=1 Tax=Gorillibacterium sp. sgz500922 TaxID=3446694 RepID=UPI003F669480
MNIRLNDELTLRRLETEDAGLLEAWLSDPRVLEYYEGRDRPHDRELVWKHFYEDREGIASCMIRYQEKDIGFLQYYLLDEAGKEEYGCADEPGRIYGMDQFIGEPAFWNRGIGSALVAATADYLIGHERADGVVLDPQAWNTRAIRAYEKAGFVKKSLLLRHEWHEGEWRDCWIMIRKAGGEGGTVCGLDEREGSTSG